MPSGMHGLQFQDRHLIVRVGGTARTTDDGFQDSWGHVTDGRQDHVQKFLAQYLSSA